MGVLYTTTIILSVFYNEIILRSGKSSNKTTFLGAILVPNKADILHTMILLSVVFCTCIAGTRTFHPELFLWDFQTSSLPFGCTLTSTQPLTDPLKTLHFEEALSLTSSITTPAAGQQVRPLIPAAAALFSLCRLLRRRYSALPNLTNHNVPAGCCSTNCHGDEVQSVSYNSFCTSGTIRSRMRFLTMLQTF